jgi:thioredoxin 1
MWIALTVTLLILAALGTLIIIARQRMKSIKDLPDSSKIHILNDQNFTAKTKTGTVLVDFWAAWCMPCKLMVPVLNELAEEAGDRITVAKLNVDDSPKVAGKYGIRSIPTMIVFRHGKEIKRIVGVKAKDYLLKEIDRLGYK